MNRLRYGTWGSSISGRVTVRFKKRSRKRTFFPQACIMNRRGDESLSRKKLRELFPVCLPLNHSGDSILSINHGRPGRLLRSCRPGKRRETAFPLDGTLYAPADIPMMTSLYVYPEWIEQRRLPATPTLRNDSPDEVKSLKETLFGFRSPTSSPNPRSSSSHRYSTPPLEAGGKHYGSGRRRCPLGPEMIPPCASITDKWPRYVGPSARLEQGRRRRHPIPRRRGEARSFRLRHGRHSSTGRSPNRNGRESPQRRGFTSSLRREEKTPTPRRRFARESGGRSFTTKIEKNRRFRRGRTDAQEEELLKREPAYGNMAELDSGLGKIRLRPCGEILLDRRLGLPLAFGRKRGDFGGRIA